MAPQRSDTTPATEAPPPIPHLRRWRGPAALALVAVLVIGLIAASPILLRILRDGAGQDPVVGATTIVLADDWFTPSVVEVAAGTTLTFVWEDGEVPHDIVFDDGVVADLRTTGTWTRAMTEPGELRFRCTLHPGMTGRVVITP